MSRSRSGSRQVDERAAAAGAKRRRLVFMCGLVPVVATAVLAIYRPAFFPRLDDAVYDTVMRSAPHAAARANTWSSSTSTSGA